MIDVNYKMIMEENAQRIMSILVRSIYHDQTATTLAKNLKLSRWGVWKILKKLERKKLILLESVGSGKTSTYLIKLNWKSVLLERTLSLILTQEALDNERWRFNFSELEKYVDFLILYGSILHSPKHARDIDIVNVFSKDKMKGFNKIILKIQKTQDKKIHAINLTSTELKKELKSGNKAFLDSIKKGIILFGQEKFVKFIKSMQK